MRDVLAWRVEGGEVCDDSDRERSEEDGCKRGLVLKTGGNSMMEERGWWRGWGEGEAWEERRVVASVKKASFMYL